MNETLEEFLSLRYDVMNSPHVGSPVYEEVMKDFKKLEKQVEFALRLTKQVEEQLLKDKAFMWGKDEKLKGFHSTLTRRGILQLLVDKANNE